MHFHFVFWQINRIRGIVSSTTGLESHSLVSSSTEQERRRRIEFGDETTKEKITTNVDINFEEKKKIP